MSDQNETRDARGEWRPDAPCGHAPLFQWPVQFGLLGKWLFGYPGYLRPYNLFHVSLAALTWFVLQPSLETCATLKPGWISLMLLRNAILMFAAFFSFMDQVLAVRGCGGRPYLETSGFTSIPNLRGLGCGFDSRSQISEVLEG